tara:strand:- start:63 stop:203 length:141 start_codon:yes stop_codon:yes gene_type:complete
MMMMFLGSIHVVAGSGNRIPSVSIMKRTRKNGNDEEENNEIKNNKS